MSAPGLGGQGTSDRPGRSASGASRAAGAGPGPGVKICGCRSPEDARVAVEAGATHVGVVFATSPRQVTPEAAVEIVAAVADRARAVGVFVDAPREEVLAVARASGVAAVQLHGQESPEACAALRAAGLEVWKGLRPRSPDELEDLVDRYRKVVDAILVEGFSPAAAGGTGTGFPLAWLDGVRDRLGVGGPAVVLAGGLTPGNVAEAIRQARPAVVDVASGVERRPGVKDRERILAFVRAARTAAETEPAEDVAGP